MKITKTKYFMASTSLLLMMCFSVIGKQQVIQPEAIPASKHVMSELFLDISSVGQRLVAVGQRGHILFSDDDGATWWQADVPTERLLTAVTFTESGIGWAVGHDAIILKSNDKGRTWFGVHGALLSSSPSDDPLFDIHFIDNNVGYAIGGFGLVLSTQDGGHTWDSVGELLPNEDGMHLNQITSDGLGNVYIAGEAGLFLHSADNGKHWRQVEFPYAGTLKGVVANLKGSIITFGLRGHIFVGNSSASQWHELNINQTNTLNGATLTADGELVLVGGDGLILYHHDSQWKSHPHQNRLPISAVKAINDNLLIVVGMAGIERIFINQHQKTSKSEAKS